MTTPETPIDGALYNARCGPEVLKLFRAVVRPDTINEASISGPNGAVIVSIAGISRFGGDVPIQLQSYGKHSALAVLDPGVRVGGNDLMAHAAYILETGDFDENSQPAEPSDEPYTPMRAFRIERDSESLGVKTAVQFVSAFGVTAIQNCLGRLRGMCNDIE